MGILPAEFDTFSPGASGKYSAFGADLAPRRPANSIALCDGHGIDFVTVAEQILMAIHNNPVRPIPRHVPMRRKSRFEIPKRDGPQRPANVTVVGNPFVKADP